MGVSRATCHTWLRLLDEEGWAGRKDRSFTPHSCPHALPPHRAKRILAAGAKRTCGPNLPADLGHPRSRICGVLCRQDKRCLLDLDRPSGTPIRYKRGHPGKLLQNDPKKLGRVPPGGGHRMSGDRRTRGRGSGHDFIHVGADDHSRYAFTLVHPGTKGVSAAGFLLEGLPTSKSSGSESIK